MTRKTEAETPSAPENLSAEHLDYIRYGLIVPYLESLGYTSHGGDGSFREHSTDRGGLDGWHQFHNPVSGNTLIVDIRCEEKLHHPTRGDVELPLLKHATPQGSA
jgi:hypothetical protein